MIRLPSFWILIVAYFIIGQTVARVITRFRAGQIADATLWAVGLAVAGAVTIIVTRWFMRDLTAHRVMRDIRESKATAPRFIK